MSGRLALVPTLLRSPRPRGPSLPRLRPRRSSTSGRSGRPRATASKPCGGPTEGRPEGGPGHRPERPQGAAAPAHGAEHSEPGVVRPGPRAGRPGPAPAGRGPAGGGQFREALALDPYLPDAYFAQAQVELKDMPLGIVPAIRQTVAGTTARLPTARGAEHARALLVPVGLLAAFATGLLFALAMILRHGALLLHDIEEFLGPGRRSVAVAIYAVVLLLPVITFQGYGWLPALVAGPPLRVPEPAGARGDGAHPGRLRGHGARGQGGGVAAARPAQSPVPGEPARPGGRTRQPRGPGARGRAPRPCGRPRPRVPAGRPVQEVRPLRRLRPALPRGASRRGQPRRGPQQPGQPGVRGGGVQGRHRPLQAGHRDQPAGPRRGHALLQPLAGAPPALRVPARPGGAVAGRPPGQRPRAELRLPLEVRGQERIRGGGPVPHPRGGVLEVRGAAAGPAAEERDGQGPRRWPRRTWGAALINRFAVAPLLFVVVASRGRRNGAGPACSP